MKCEYIEENGKKYLRFEKEIEDELDSVTIGMLEHNNITGTNPFVMIQSDDKIIFKYDITGKYSIAEALKGKITRKKVIHFLEEVEQICKNCQSYLIPFNQILLNPQYIYMNQGEAYFIVLPINKQDENFNEALKSLFYNMDFDKTENCSYVAELLSYFQHNGQFSLNHFTDMLRSIENENGKNTVADKAPFVNSNSGNTYSERKEPLENTVAMKYEEHNVARQDRVLYNQQPSQQVTSHTPVIPDRQLKQESNNKKRGFSFFGKKNNGEDKESKNKKSGKEKKSIFGGLAIPGAETISNGEVEKEVLEKQEIKQQKVDINYYQIEEEDFGKTVFLDEPEPHSENYYLRRISTGESYPISKKINKIGRKESIVDIYIKNNPHIGRLHAIIYYENQKLSIVDNGSGNGTFINNSSSRITDKVMLQRGDKIKFGDEEFIIE